MKQNDREKQRLDGRGRGHREQDILYQGTKSNAGHRSCRTLRSGDQTAQKTGQTEHRPLPRRLHVRTHARRVSDFKEPKWHLETRMQCQVCSMVFTEQACPCFPAY